MALDTAAKRSSASGVARPWLRGQVADAAAGLPWRLNVGLGYSGASPTLPATTAALTGTAVPSATSVDWRQGGLTLVIELALGTWVGSGSFDAERQAILSGITSSGSELTGFNNEVRDKEVVTAVVRTSDTVVTVTFSAAPQYNTAVGETIEVTVPSSAITGAPLPVVATPTFAVLAYSLWTPDSGKNAVWTPDSAGTGAWVSDTQVSS